MDHPWRRLRDRPDWLLEWDMLPPGLMGSTCHRRRVITLDLRLSQAERRCTISLPAHRTEEGDAFARAVGGWDVEECHIAACCCTESDEEN